MQNATVDITLVRLQTDILSGNFSELESLVCHDLPKVESLDPELSSRLDRLSTSLENSSKGAFQSDWLSTKITGSEIQLSRVAVLPSETDYRRLGLDSYL